MIRRSLILFFVTVLAFSTIGTLTAVLAGLPTVHGTFLGGDLPDYGRHLAVDHEGGVYIVGRSESLNFPTGTLPLPLQPSAAHGIDAFVAKFNNDGSQAEYILWLYTQVFQALDEADGIAVDAQGHAYVVGNTASDDFCSLFGNVPGYDTTYNDSGDGFLFKVLPDGSGVAYCTFLGGSDLDRATAVALDSAGNAYVTGGTFSTDFVTSTSTVNNQHSGARDAFLLVLDATGTAVLHASLLGGSGQDEGKAVALDSNNNVHLTGWTNSTNFITTTGVFGPAHHGDFDAFLVKINTTTPALNYATYLGGSGEDRGFGLQTDGAGFAYVGGQTRSFDFPTTTDAYDTEFAGGGDGFAARVNPDGTALSYSTFLGGSGDDQINDITLDDNRNLWAAGTTWSTDFPTTTNALLPGLPGGQSAFVAVLNPTGRQLEYGTFLGGSDWDLGTSIAYDANQWVYVVGSTRSADFPIAANAFAITHSGDYDAYFSSFAVTVTNTVAADFTAVPTAGPPPLTVQFTNLSVGESLTATWDFGDGQISSLLHPTHTYTIPGSFTVTLTVSGPDGSDIITRPHYIRTQWALYLPVIGRP